jgi:hypothetical protein
LREFIGTEGLEAFVEGIDRDDFASFVRLGTFFFFADMDDVHFFVKGTIFPGT